MKAIQGIGELEKLFVTAPLRSELLGFPRTWTNTRNDLRVTFDILSQSLYFD